MQGEGKHCHCTDSTEKEDSWGSGLTGAVCISLIIQQLHEAALEMIPVGFFFFLVCCTKLPLGSWLSFEKRSKGEELLDLGRL